MDFTKLLDVRDLNVSFKIDAGRVLAVNGVSFSLDKGKVLGIVGESGSGKSVTAYSIMGILDKNGRVDSGKINYYGTDLLRLSKKEMRYIRGNKISIIFQDAMVSLNPVYTIGNQLREAILVHAKDPLKEILHPYVNEITSDIQRIASLEKGISHHPERQNLKDDLEMVKAKLIEDREKLKIAEVEEKAKLREKETLKMAEYEDKKPDFNVVIREKSKVFHKNLFKNGEIPSEEMISDSKEMKDLDFEINKDLEAYNTALAEKDKFIANTSKEGEAFELELKGHNIAIKHLLKTYKAALRRKKHFITHAKFVAFNKYRSVAFRELLAAKKAKKDFYWECRSAYRETKWSANKKAIEMLKDVGITDPEKRFKQYPFEHSGGMLQRCMIAMALVQKPDILIADEPTTALDVTIQAQILELLKKLQAEYGMAIIIITHDLGVVAQICDEVDIMYAGRIVERGDVREIFYNPQHEYTKGLLKSMPNLHSEKGKLEPIQGNPVDLFCLPKGCAFCSRCKECMDICIEKYPEEVSYSETHRVSCWRMIKQLHDEGKIDIVNGKPEGKPLIYNGAIIANEKNKKHSKKVKEVKVDEKR